MAFEDALRAFGTYKKEQKQQGAGSFESALQAFADYRSTREAMGLPSFEEQQRRQTAQMRQQSIFGPGGINDAMKGAYDSYQSILGDGKWHSADEIARAQQQISGAYSAWQRGRQYYDEYKDLFGGDWDRISGQWNDIGNSLAELQRGITMASNEYGQYADEADWNQKVGYARQYSGKSVEELQQRLQEISGGNDYRGGIDQTPMLTADLEEKQRILDNYSNYGTQDMDTRMRLIRERDMAQAALDSYTYHAGDAQEAAWLQDFLESGSAAYNAGVQSYGLDLNDLTPYEVVQWADDPARTAEQKAWAEDFMTGRMQQQGQVGLDEYRETARNQKVYQDLQASLTPEQKAAYDEAVELYKQAHARENRFSDDARIALDNAVSAYASLMGIEYDEASAQIKSGGKYSAWMDTQASWERLSSYAAEHPFAASALTVATQPFANVLANADILGAQLTQQQVRSYDDGVGMYLGNRAIRQQGEKHAGELTQKIGLGEKSGQWLYNTVMSAADSAVNAAIMGLSMNMLGGVASTPILGGALKGIGLETVGTLVGHTVSNVIMGSGAAVDSYIEYMQRGYSKNQAFYASLAAGFFEGLTEGIGGEGTADRMLNLWGRIGRGENILLKTYVKQFLSEGVEEVAGNLFNDIFLSAAMNDPEAYDRIMDRLQGLLVGYAFSGIRERDKGFTQAWMDTLIGEDFSSFMAGGLSALISGGSSVLIGGVRNTISDISTGRQMIREGYRNAANVNTINDSLRQNAVKGVAPISENTGSYKLGRATRRSNQAQSERNVNRAVQEAKKAAAQIIDEKLGGSTWNAGAKDDYAGIAAKRLVLSMLNESQITDNMREILDLTENEQRFADDKYGTIRDIVNMLSRDEGSGERIMGLLNTLNTDLVAGKLLDKESAGQIQEGQDPAKFIQEKRAVLTAAAAMGVERREEALEKLKSNKDVMTDEQIAAIYDQAARRAEAAQIDKDGNLAVPKSASTAAVKFLKETFNAIPAEDSKAREDFSVAGLRAYNLGLNYGGSEYAASSLKNQMAVYPDIGKQIQAAYDAGLAERQGRGLAVASAATAATAEERAQRRTGRISKANVEAFRKSHRNVNRVGANGINTINEVTAKNLTREQWNMMDMSRNLSRLLNVNIVYFSSRDADDNYATDENGRIIGSNGWWDAATNTIYLDIYAGLDNGGSVTFTLAHELTHMMRTKALDHYQALANFVTDYYHENKITLDVGGRTVQLSYDDALGAMMREEGFDKAEDAQEEIVAQACEDMLTNSTAIRTLAEQQPETADFIQKAIARLVRVWESVVKRISSKSASRYARNLRQSLDAVKQMQKLWDEGIVAAAQRGDAEFREAMQDAAEIGASAQMAEEAIVRNSSKLDQETLDFLDNQEHVTVYRAMQVIDGKLYPPMAAQIRDENGKLQYVEPTEISQWYQAVERPDLLDKNGKFVLNKGNGTNVPAAYNPYFHSSASPLNDQFSSAWKRPNLVVVEGEIPASELTSGYRAQGAKNTVGETKWHSGPVASKLKGDKARRVFLSRWFRVNRIMTDAEVADIVADTLQGENVKVPSNVVTPGLLSELRARGVPIEEKNAAQGGVKFSPKDRYGNVTVEGDVTPEQVRAQLQSIVDNPKQNLDFTFPILREAPFVYEYATKIPGTRSFVMHGAKAAQAMLNRNSDDHNLGVNGLMQVIAKLRDPDYIVYQGEGRNAGHYAAVLNINNGDALAVVDLRNYRGSENATVNSESGFYDVLVTAYDKLDKEAAKKYASFEDYILSILEGEYNDVVYDKEKDEESMRVALSERLSGRAEESSSTDSVTGAKQSVKTNDAGRGEKFSMKTPVEETKDLLAVHGMTAENLRGALRLGGLPMPSIAIVKANEGHNRYGEISLVFDKRTIDPQADRRNKVYGADAWTPTAPRVDYEVDEKASLAFERRINELASGVAGGIFSSTSVLRQRGIDDATNMSADELADKLAGDDTVRAAYLAEQGKALEPVRRVKEFDQRGNEFLQKIIDGVGVQELASMMSNIMEHGMTEQQTEAVREIWRQDYVDTIPARLKEKRGVEFVEQRARERANDLRDGQIENYVRHAWEMYEDGGATKDEVDRIATSNALREAVDRDEVASWVRPQLDEILGEPGIYNGRDPYTPSGSRRGFRALHDAYTLENIVKAMQKNQAERGEGMWGGAGAKSLQATATPSYRSIAEIKADSGRLGAVDEQAYNAAMAEMNDRVDEIINEIVGADGSFYGREIAGDLLMQAAQGKRTTAAVRSLFTRESALKVSEETAKKILQLYKAAASLPTEYFEAKPQRAVGFDEILAAIVPTNMDESLKKALADRGVQTLEYELYNDADRTEKLNSVEGAKFSRKSAEPESEQMEALRKELQQRTQETRELTAELARVIKARTRETDAWKKAVRGLVPQLWAAEAERMAKQIVRAADSTANEMEIRAQLRQMGETLLTVPENDSGESLDALMQQASDLAQMLVETAQTREAGEYYDQLRGYFKGLKIYFPRSLRSDITPDNWTDWLRTLPPGLTVVGSNSIEHALPIDTVYQELQGQFGESLFPSDRINPADQLQRIVDVMRQEQSRTVNPFGSTRAEQQYAAVGLAAEYLTQVDDRITALLEQLATPSGTASAALRAGRRAARMEETVSQQENEIDSLQKDIELVKWKSERDKKRAQDIIRELRAEIQGADTQISGMRTLLETQRQKIATTEKALLAERRRVSKLERQMEAEATKHREAMKRLRAQKNDRMDELLKKERERHQEAMSKLRSEKNARAEKMYMEAAQRGRERLQRYRIQRDQGEAVKRYRSRIEGDVKELLQLVTENSDKRHVPDQLREPLAEFLQSIDLESAQASEGGPATRRDQDWARRFERLTSALNAERADELEGKSDANLYLPDDFYELMNKAAEAVRAFTERYGGTSVYDSDADTLRDLSKVLQILTHAVRSANQTMVNRYAEKISDLARQTMNQLRPLGKGKTMNWAEGWLNNLILWQNGTPYYVFKRFGEAGFSTFQAIMDGQGKLAATAEKIIQDSRTMFTSDEVREWQNEVHEVEISGDRTVRMTTAQLMSFYCLSKRQQAVGHLLGGGMKIDAFKDGRKTVDDRTDYVLGVEDVQAINSLLTDRQREVADAIQRYMSTYGSDLGNEVTMRRFGYKAYGESNYFPIVSDKQNLNGTSEEEQRASLLRLLNMSHTKSLVDNANNAIVIQNIFDVFSNHMSDMAEYNALALPVLDMVRWFNYMDRTNTGTGSQIDTDTVQKSLATAFGGVDTGGGNVRLLANEYVKTFLKDLNGNNERGRDIGIGNLMSRYKRASVAANLRVAIQQPMSIARASAVLDPKWIVRGIADAARAPRETSEELSRYSNEAKWKNQGHHDIYIGRSVAQQIKDDQTFIDRAVEKSMIMAELGDKATWTALWAACRAEQQSKGLSGEALMDATAARFQEVIYSTQVMDATTTRSQSMRSNSPMNQMWTAFMAEPTLSVNLLANSYVQWRLESRRGGDTAEARKKAFRATGRVAVRAIAAYAVNALFVTLAESLVDAFRDDDDYETFVDKYLQALGENWLEELNPLSKVTVLKDVLNIFTSKYGAGDRMDLAALTSAKKSADILIETYKVHVLGQKPTETTYYGKMTLYGGIYQLLKTTSQITGVPFAGLSREIQTVWNNMLYPGLKAVGVNDIGRLKTYDESAKNVGYPKLYDAIVDGDEKTALRLRQEMYYNGISDEDVVKGLTEQIKTHFTAGDIDREEASRLLVEYCGYEVLATGSDSLGFTLDQWEFGSDYKISARLEAAFDAEDAAAVREAVEYNRTTYYQADSAIKSTITSYWKKKYAEGTSKATVKRMMMATGLYSAEDVEKKFDEWDKAIAKAEAEAAQRARAEEEARRRLLGE